MTDLTSGSQVQDTFPTLWYHGLHNLSQIPRHESRIRGVLGAKRLGGVEEGVEKVEDVDSGVQ